MQIFAPQNILTLMGILELADICFRQRKKQAPDKRLIWGAIIGAAISLVGKFVIPLFRRRKYGSGEYALGKVYIRNVLGQSIGASTTNVGDDSVYLAQLLFTAGFGIFIETEGDLLKLEANDYDGYVAKYKTNAPNYKFSRDQWDRAVILKKMYFPLQSNPPLHVWDLANFEKRPYLGPIPDISDPSKPMNAELPGNVFVKDGYFVNPSPAEAAAIRIAEGSTTAAAVNQEFDQALQQGVVPGSAVLPAQASTAGKSNILLFLGLGVGAYLLTRKRG